MHNNFKVYRSSAGSGKTYTLALSFIALALKGDRNGYENYYRKILAITFTNKAAAEMKHRVLQYFSVLSMKKDIENILDWLINNTELSKDQIFKRSEIINKHILHNYSDLGILTIDKFTYRIVRTFANDLGLSHNFDLELDSYKIIQPVIAILLDKISSSGGELSNALVNFALQKAEDGKSTNIENDLEQFSKQLFKEEISKYTAGKTLNVKECIFVRDNLNTSKDNIKSSIRLLAKDVCDFFNKSGLTSDHFLRGTFFKYFTNILKDNDDSRWNPSDALKRNISKDMWYAEGKSQDIKDLVDLCKIDLKNFYNRLINLLMQYNSIKSILKNIYSIAILNEILGEIKLFKKENNIEQISEFNSKINNIVTSQPSSFIYERLGERYNHYLIDEFQDTSLLQWQNILPLITDSIDYSESLVVGDGKQSIYRWRGGEVQQFSELPTIFNGEDLIFKKEWESKLHQHYKGINLEYNFRSGKNIIEFNNDFFSKTKKILAKDISSIYNSHSQDTSFAKNDGYVHVELFGDKSNFKELILENMLIEINKICKENNYNFNDITILCNSKKSVSLVAEYLSDNDIPVISNEGLLINKSKEVNVLISVLRFLQEPKNNIAKTVIVDYLYQTKLSSYNLHDLNIKLCTKDGFDSILKDSGVFINPIKLLQEPLYELVEQLVRVFNFNDDSYLCFFLDAVLAYSEKKGSSLSEFLNWWEEKKVSESIVLAEDADAVNVMTIHKSKGLAFNVVMIPFNWEDRKRVNNIWVDTSKLFNQKLPAALISSNKSLENSYFKSEYQNEKEMSLLDSYNKLYVAMTRAKERLYVFSKSFPDKIKDDFCIKGDLNSFLYAYDTKYPVIIGDKDMIHLCEPINKRIFSVEQRKKLDWKEVISLKHSAEEIWDIDDVNAKRDWGKLLHLALSQIHYSNQKNEVLDMMYKSGVCVEDDYEKLKVTITKLFAHKQVKPLFDDAWEVKTEKEILTKEGRTYIPDRLMFSKKSNEIVIVDYKTAIDKEKYRLKHETQINEYADVLKMMGKTNIRKVLIYTSDPILVI